MTTHCTPFKAICQIPNSVKPSRIEADFSGGEITSDGGLLLTSQLAWQMRLFERIAQCFADHRQPQRIVHPLDAMTGQRILGLVHGYEDLNDHEQLRKDQLLGAVLGCVESVRKDCQPLAGKSTLNRLELAAGGLDTERGRKVQVDFEQLDQLLLELFIESRPEPPESIVLDVDATDFELHGGQQQKFYHGYYREYCYMPLLVFCDDFPLLVRLRSAAHDAAAGVAELLQWLVRGIRQHWPHTQLIVRTDSGFCRDEIMSYCEDTAGVEYVIGLPGNSRLKGKTWYSRLCAANQTRISGEASRVFCEFDYQTRRSWSRQRRVICKAEALPNGYNEDEQYYDCKENARYIVTSLTPQTHPAQALYEDFYCQRGDAENRLREVKVDLFAQRCSSNLFDANTLRLYLSTFAHILFIYLRRRLEGTELAHCQPATIRLKLLKIGAIVKRSTRRLHVAMSSAFPHQHLFVHLWQQLRPT